MMIIVRILTIMLNTIMEMMLRWSLFEEFNIHWGKHEIPATPLPPWETLGLT